MTTPLFILLMLASLVAIGVLIWIIRRQLGSLRDAKRARQTEQALLRERHSADIDSIRILARSVLADQVEYSEACIRIKMLLDSAAPELHDDERFAVFDLVYRELQEHPTHEARQAISKQQRHDLDKERFALEDSHHQAIRDASEALLEHPSLNRSA